MKEDSSKSDSTVAGQQFDNPLYVTGELKSEPERYIGEKPYELSKYEYSILKRNKIASKFWFQIVWGNIGDAPHICSFYNIGVSGTGIDKIHKNGLTKMIEQMPKTGVIWNL